MDLTKISIHAWIKKYGIKTESGDPIEFRSHTFLYDIYKDFSPKIVVYKAAQIGWSTAAILKSFWIAYHRKMDIIYTLPTVTDVRQFAGGKIDRIVANNPVLNEWVSGHDTIEQKKVGDSIIYYRGTFTEKQAMMVSSDLNIYDEVDASKQSIIEQYSTRLQHSDYGWEWYFSHPSTEGAGVSQYWPRSDQKHWFVKCTHCNKRQYINFPDNIDFEREIFVCKKCRKELTDEDRRIGEWVKKVNEAEFSGYWIPLMICPWRSAKDIIKPYKEKSEEHFTTKVLGLPYVGSGNKITWEVIKKNLKEGTNEQAGRVVIGVDTGTTTWYVVGNQEGLFYYGKTKGYDEIESLLRRWPTSIAVFDQGGDLMAPRQLQEKYPGRIFLCYYGTDRKTQQLVRWGSNDEEGRVVVDRNRTIQLIVDEFTDGNIPIWGNESDWYNYYLHWKNIYRVVEENKLGVPVKRWERSGDDHWVHATVYWRVAMDRFAQESSDIISDRFKGIPSAPVINPDGTSITKHPKQIWKIK